MSCTEVLNVHKFGGSLEEEQSEGSLEVSDIIIFSVVFEHINLGREYNWCLLFDHV